MEFIKEKNEHEYHFIWRVYDYFKSTGSSLAEAGEICNRELKVDYDESRHRKIYENWLKVHNVVIDEYTDTEENEIIKQIKNTEDELYKMKVKTADKLREWRSCLRDDARIEHLLEYIIEASKHIEPNIYNNVQPIEFGSNTGILKISDWHIGKDFKNYINEYNSKISKQRIDKLIAKTLKHCKMMNIGELYIANIGDIIDGSIRVTARITQEEDSINQVLKAYQMIKYLIEVLHDSGLKIKYLSTLDNHSRVTSNWKEHIEKENFGKLIDYFLIENLSDKVDFIENKIDDNIGMIEIDGKVHVFAHGHLKAHNISSVLKNMSTVIGKRVDYVHLGHWHSEKGITDAFSKIYINGSLVGVDEFAFNQGYFANPSQSIFVCSDNDNINIEMILK